MESGCSGVADAPAYVGWGELGDKVPDVASAQQEEDQGKQCQESAGDEFGDGACRGQRAAGQLLLVASQCLDRGVTEVVDLVGPKMQRSVDQPAPGAVDALGNLINQLG